MDLRHRDYLVILDPKEPCLERLLGTTKAAHRPKGGGAFGLCSKSAS